MHMTHRIRRIQELGKQIEERAREIAKHQRALLQEGCAGEGQAEAAVVRTIVKRKKQKTGIL